VRYAAAGDAGRVHTLRGRASNRKTADASRSAVLKLYRAKYAGFGPTLACEYLLKDGHAVSHDALGRWLRAEGLIERRRWTSSAGTGKRAGCRRSWGGRWPSWAWS